MLFRSTPNVGLVTPGPPYPIIYGVAIGLMGLQLHLALKQLIFSGPALPGAWYRPHRFRLGAQSVIELSWDDPTFGDEVLLEREEFNAKTVPENTIDKANRNRSSPDVDQTPIVPSVPLPSPPTHTG